MMDIGIHGLNTHMGVNGAATARLARRAEDLGYESWWAADHVVVPVEPIDGIDPEMPVVDPLVHLAFAAAATDRLRLGTGVMVLPQRNPFVLAKQAASLDVLSGGRLLLGIGAGWLEPELTALGVPLRERGERTDDHLAAMAALWAGPPMTHEGPHSRVVGVKAAPLPVRSGGPPIIVGGHSPAAFRRAQRFGAGWFGNGSLDDLTDHLAGLHRAGEEVDRPTELGELQITYMVLGGPVDSTIVSRAADLGVDRLLLFALPLRDEPVVSAFLERHAELLG